VSTTNTTDTASTASRDFYWYEDEGQLKHDLETWGKAEVRGFRLISPLFSYAEAQSSAATDINGIADIEELLNTLLPYGDSEHQLGKLIGTRLERLAEAIDALVARKALASDYKAAVTIAETLHRSVLGRLVEGRATQTAMKELAESTREFAEITKDRW
jgi:hypothetical protein